MNRLIRTVVPGAMFLLGASAFAADTFSGTFEAGGTARKVTDAVAHGSEEKLTLAFTDQAINRSAFSRQIEVGLMFHEGATLNFVLDPRTGDVRRGETRVDQDSVQAPEALEKALKLTRIDDKRIAGSLKLDTRYDLKFDLAVLGEKYPEPPRPGKPLPADGGKPGAALLAMVKAVKAGNLDALVALAPPERAQSMREAIADGEAESMLKSIQAFTPTAVTITGGNVHGDEAWVDFTGSGAMGSSKGTATLKHEAGTWFVTTIKTGD